VALERIDDLVGGPARRRVIALLACVLALDSADKATVGAMGSNLESALHIGNTELGLLAAVTPLVGALATIPAGMLADRTRRNMVLVAAIALWSGAMILSAASVSYLMLLLTRLAVGVVSAAAGPNVASLTGDYFPGGERARIYGFILSGELVGAAFGFLITGEVAGVLSWRYSFLALAISGLALAGWLWRRLPEPARGGQSRLEAGATEIRSADTVADEPAQVDGSVEQRPDELVQEQVRRKRIPPRPEIVLERDPRNMSIWDAVRYALSVPSNRLLIIASALGYYFFAGLQTFAVIYLERHFSVSHSVATALLAVVVVAAVSGALIGGRLADRLIRHGHLSARVVVPAVANIVAVVVLGPAFALALLGPAIVLFILGGISVAAPNPPLDAARLDIIPHGLWGRAEAVRTVLRTIAQGIAPFMFGYVSEHVVASAHPSSSATGFGANASATGLQYTFSIMLVALLLSGVIMLRARRTYPPDVAAVMTTEQRLAESATSPS